MNGKYMRIAANTPLTEEERAQLRALAQKPDSEIDFSDIPERIYPEDYSLKPHAVVLQVEDEVAAWLEKADRSDAIHINNALKREVQRSRLRAEANAREQFQKAS